MNEAQTTFEEMLDLPADPRPSPPAAARRSEKPAAAIPPGTVLDWKAIAAMAENRVIGHHNGIPWHLPEDFRWFKECTLGQIVVMGRKTFESLPKPLPGRTTFVLTRNPKLLRDRQPNLFASGKVSRSALAHRESMGQMPLAPFAQPDLRLIPSLDLLARESFPCQVFICGGAEIYRQALPFCRELLLTRVHRTVEGDTQFPAFEPLFERAAILRETPDFTIERWTRRGPVSPPPGPPGSP